MRGVIVKALSGFYYVESEDGSVTECRARGLFRLDGTTPLVGDKVEFSDNTVTQVLPRLNAFDRPPCANVETLVICCAAADPDPSFEVIDKLSVAAEAAGARVVICVNKSDLLTDELRGKFEKIYGNVYPLVFTSALDGQGTERLSEELRGSQAALCGPSGCGKSSLTNLLTRSEASQTGSISEKTGRGKNTTRHTELFDADGFMLFDTPGFTSFDVPELEAEQVQHMFPDIRPYIGKCAFSDCAHLKEPGCAVTDAVRAGFIARARYRSYRTIYSAAKQREETHG